MPDLRLSQALDLSVLLELLEADPRPHLDQTWTGRRRDLAIIRRGQSSRWCVEADHVERVRGVSSKLQTNSTLKAEVSGDPQIDVPVTWRSQEVARRIPIGSSWTNSAWVNRHRWGVKAAVLNHRCEETVRLLFGLRKGFMPGTRLGRSLL